MPTPNIIDPAHEPKLSLGGLPWAIVASLTLDEPAHFLDDERPLAKRLRELMCRMRVSNLDLLKLMGLIRINKSLRSLDAAKRGKSSDNLFIRRAYDCLGVSAEAFAAILAEEEEFSAMRRDMQIKRHAHFAFHMLGPHLVAILLPEYREIKPSFEGPYRYLCAQVAYATEGDQVITLATGEVASAVQADAAWLPRVARWAVQVYLYHRMPDEVHVIDPAGNILLSGDWRLYHRDRVLEWLSTSQPHLSEPQQ